MGKLLDFNLMCNGVNLWPICLFFHSAHPRASEHDLYRSFWQMPKVRFSVGSSFIPQKHSFCGSPTESVSKCGFFPGDHIGSPLRNSRHLVKGFSTRRSRALDETSRFRATTWGRPYGIRGASAHGLFARFSWRKSFTFSTSASFFPQKQSFCGRHTKPLWIHVSKFAALGKRFFHSA